ncbi:dihydrodipicolinate synthase family protein [Streptomonospora wellingtoniae]|uniref:Dihydrodipicolinate synthase family protein n=1 Tax=Streptomonospora wellingtoniae TaxID=3075544 RepID=A0ABU2KQ34_9ACTN|nr:dihydrodipicolinate synthase family protein [Streptomonospora sp. DSM 45055]MDT0301368.1 dihydrodipicolinate synthase family protein [Streptomonospora sp. DSM 45055]
MFTGLSAFPITPVTGDGIDEAAFERMVGRIAASGADSVGALGSTGGYAYLSRRERARAARLAVRSAGDVPVTVGVGALRTRDVLEHVEDAQEAGASAVLLAPLTYQPLNDDEVFGLYEDVAANLSVPLVVYDNPATTHVAFSDELHGRIAHLPGVASVKIPPVPADPGQARARVAGLRAALPAGVTIGVSGDAAGADGLLAGCEAWYSALAGVLPEVCLAVARAAAAGEAERARALSAELDPLWELFARYGSYRVVSAIAVELGRACEPNLPRPVRPLDGTGRRAVAAALDTIVRTSRSPAASSIRSA